MYKIRTIASKKHFFLLNHQFFYLSPKSSLKVSWRLERFGDLKGMSQGHRLPAGHTHTNLVKR